MKRVCTTPLTFEIHLSVPIEVYISQDLVDLAVVELLPHELLHGLPQLSKADLTVAVRVKLRGENRGCREKNVLELMPVFFAPQDSQGARNHATPDLYM